MAGSRRYRSGFCNNRLRSLTGSPVRKLELILWTVLLWLLASGAHAYYYVTTILALPEDYDAYARNWKFQLLMFSLFRLPWLVLVLAVLIGVIVVLPRRRTTARLPTDVSAR
jgi:hypothetical protein